MLLAERVRAIEASQTIALDTRAKALVAAGQPVINLTAGELDFAVPATVTEAVQTALTAPTLNRYSAVAGLMATREAIAKYLATQHHLTFSPQHIVVTNGAKHALYYCFQALVNPGDEVLVLQPGWVSYREQIILAGGTPIPVATTDTFQPDLTLLEHAISPRTVGLVLNYPNNPTGAVYDRTTLTQLAAFAQHHGLWVVSDEIYEQLLYDDTEFVSFARLYDQTILVNGISKAAAVTGWRLGYVAGPDACIQAITTLQSHCTGNVSNVMQAAVHPGLTIPPQIRQQWLATLHERRTLILNWVKQQPRIRLVPPNGAFYCFLDIRQLPINSISFCDELLRTQYVALVPGKYFGREGFVRLSFAHETTQVHTALERLAQYIRTVI